MTVTLGAVSFDMLWEPLTMALSGFLEWLRVPVEGDKEGPAFVLASLHKGRRLKKSVSAIYGIGLDVDSGIATEALDGILANFGCLAVRYPTHSHLKRSSTFARSRVRKFCKGAEITDDILRRYAVEVMRWEPGIAETLRYEGTIKQGKAVLLKCSHAPMPKHRIIVPLRTPYIVGETQTVDDWPQLPRGLADLLGVPVDESCFDAARLFYFPRYSQGNAHESVFFDGPLFDYNTLPFQHAAPRPKRKTVPGDLPAPDVANLAEWVRVRGTTFQIVDLIEAKGADLVRGGASATGVTIECSFDEEHSDAGNPRDKGCFVVNAGDSTRKDDGFVIWCGHHSCQGRSREEHVAKWIADGRFTREDIDDPAFHAVFEDEKCPATDNSEKECFDFYDEETLVQEIDAICRICALGNQRRFVFLGRDAEPQFLDKTATEIELSQYKYWYNKGTEEKPDWKSIPAFKVWLGSSLRKPNFAAARFDPNLKTGDVGNGLLNLWTGFAMKPAPGNWSRLRTHIWENICQHNEQYFAFLMGCLAQLFQEPGHKIGVAVVLRGDLGVGKTKLAEWVGNIIGDHHSVVCDKSEQCTGKFNAGLERNIFISAEEAFFAGDPKQTGPLKHLITGHKLMYEPKGRDAYMGRNYSHLMMTTNAKFAVPAVARERRYFVLDVSPARQKNSAYFRAIDEQMKAGGAEAMLAELLAWDYSEVDFQNPPMTDALRDIIRRGIDDAEKWLVAVLSEGRFPVRSGSGREEAEWTEDGCEAQKSTVVDSYNDFVPSYKKVPANSQDVQLFLRERIGVFHSSKMKAVVPPWERSKAIDKRVPSWKFPPLAQARETYATAMGHVFEDDASLSDPCPTNAKRSDSD